MKWFFSLLFFSCLAQAEIVERIVAIVNSEIVSESDLRSFNKKIDKQGSLDDLLLFGRPQSVLKADKKAQLEYLINEKILDSEVKRLNLSVTSERVEQEIRDIAKRNGVSRAELLSAIKAQGLSVSEYQDFIKSRVERQSLIETEITSKIRVSDEDVAAQYSRQNPNLSLGVSEYTLAHILFLPKKGGPEAAKARALAVLGKLKSGESFEVLAEQNSEDPNFTAGGLLGTFKAGEFSKDLEGAVASLDIGEYTDVVASRMGLHIIKVLSKKMISDPRFDKEKEKIRNELFEKAFQKHFKTWLDQKKEEAFIRINI